MFFSVGKKIGSAANQHGTKRATRVVLYKEHQGAALGSSLSLIGSNVPYLLLRLRL